MKRLFFWLFFVTVLTSSTRSQASAVELSAADQIGKSQFIEITKISRLSPEAQRKQIARVYALYDEAKDSGTRSFASIIFIRAPMPKNAAELSPEGLAESIIRFNPSYLAFEAKATAANALRANKEAAKPLILHDLKSQNANEIQRGFAALRIVSHIDYFEQPRAQRDPNLPRYMKAFYQSVRQIFRRRADFKTAAARAFVNIGDTRAVGEMVNANPLNPAFYHDDLASFSSRVPPHPKLLRLLDSPDAKLRAQAMHALTSANPDIMFPYVERLLQDSDANVRWQAFFPAMYSKSPHYAALNRVLVAMLNDSDERLRWVTASSFAGKRDPISLRPLLKLLQSETLKISLRNDVVEKVRDFAGTDLGYVIDHSVEQQKLTPNNLEAIQKFQTWIEKNYPNA